jgi:N-methylhydantoinase A
MPQYRFAFDIGGTFTDLVLIDERDRVVAGKCLTTTDGIHRSVVEGLRSLLDEHGIAPSSIAEVVSGATTLVTNLIIERKGALTALITTRGFGDVLEIGREIRYDNYDLRARKPDALIGRDLRFEVEERIDARGEILTPLGVASVRECVAEIQRRGCQTVAVCLLHSYRNPVHEQAIGEIVSEMAPEMFVSLSSDILPEIREYERTVATALNAYVRPFVGEYLRQLEDALREIGVIADLYIMQSNGGIISREFAERVPLRMLESGPAAGALAAAHLSACNKVGDVLAFDMGGTTAKACVIWNNEPAVTTEFETARIHRFKKGSGFPVRLPVIDLIEIGAGGGSIAYVDDTGLMKVGPQSAGADPGPACYGRNGTLPTVTDADLLLGYLGADSFLGGKMALYPELAKTAVQTHLCEPLKLKLHEAAAGIYRIVGESMAAAMKIHAAERGIDVRQFSLVAFGGAGPVHAREVARRLHVRHVIVPVNSGVFSAFGLLVAPVRFDSVQTYYAKLAELDWRGVNGIFSHLGERAFSVLGKMGIRSREATLIRSADMRYVGQGYEVTVPLPVTKKTGAAMTSALTESFHRVYAERFGHFLDDVPAEVLSWRLNAIHGDHSRRTNGVVKKRTSAAARPYARRDVYDLDRGTFVRTRVFRHTDLRPGDRIAGPAIIEQVESTAVLGARDSCTLDAHRNLHLTIAPEGRR